MWSLIKMEHKNDYCYWDEHARMTRSAILCFNVKRYQKRPEPRWPRARTSFSNELSCVLEVVVVGGTICASVEHKNEGRYDCSAHPSCIHHKRVTYTAWIMQWSKRFWQVEELNTFWRRFSLNLFSKSYREIKECRGIRSIHWILFSGNFSGLFNCYFFMLLACCNSIDAVLTCSHNDVLDNKHHSAMMQLQAQAEEVLPYFRLTFSLLTTTGLCNWSEALKLLNLPLVDSLLLSYYAASPNVTYLNCKL